jgi:hypothetical protein
MTNFKIEITDQETADRLLLEGRLNRAKTINEIRHQCTNYEMVINSVLTGDDYAKIVAEAKLGIATLIEQSSIDRYEKYLYLLFNKRWNFFKKNDIAQRSEK